MTLIGATTENPYFEVNSALLSRTRVYELQRARRRRRRGAAAPRARPRRVRRRTRSTTTRSRSSPRAPAATRAPRWRRSSWPCETARRRRDAGGAPRTRCSAARSSTTSARRPPLRHDLGLDQGDARLGPRRLALLPGGDARGRRGPALHRPADGHPRLRGRRQRRPAGARRSRSPPRTAVEHVGMPEAQLRARAGARSTCRWRRSPTPPSARSARRARTCASTAPDRRRPTCRAPATRAPSALGRGAGLRLPARPTRATSRAQELLPDGVAGERFYEPDDAEAALRERLEAIRRGRGR